MRVSFAIQNHPARADMAAALASLIPGAEIVTDPDPDALPSPWRTYRRALETTPAGATHRLILQDDVVLCNGFPAAARAALRAQPDRVVAFFIAGQPYEHRRLVLQACDRDLAWAELPNSRWLSAVATCWPSHLIVPLLDWVDEQFLTRKWPPEFRADDEILGRFMNDAGLHPIATVPSLVQHPDVTPSLIGLRAFAGADEGRVAACWLGDCDTCDPAGIDWAAGP